MSRRRGLALGWTVAVVGTVVAVAGTIAQAQLSVRLDRPEAVVEEDAYRLRDALSIVAGGTVAVAGIAIALMLATHAVRGASPSLAVRLRGRWPLVLAAGAVVALVAGGALVLAGWGDSATPPVPGSVRSPELAADSIRDALAPVLLIAGVVLAVLAPAAVALGREPRALGGRIALAVGWSIVAAGLLGGLGVVRTVFAIQRSLELEFSGGTEFGNELMRSWQSLFHLAPVGPSLAFGGMLAGLLLLGVHAWRWQAARTEAT